MEGKYDEQPRIAVDGIELMVCTANKKIFHRKFILGPIESQRSPKNDFFPIKHNLRGPAERYVSASGRTRIMEQGIISESRPKVRKVAWENEDSDFECYERDEGKPVHVDVYKEMDESNKPTSALLPNKSEEDEINNNGETRDRVGNINLRRSNRIFKPPE